MQSILVLVLVTMLSSMLSIDPSMVTKDFSTLSSAAREQSKTTIVSSMVVMLLSVLVSAALTCFIKFKMERNSICSS